MVNSSERNGKVMEILRVEHLKKTYGEGENAVHALDDVSFSVEKGEFTAIIGPSGPGFQPGRRLALRGDLCYPARGVIR